MTKDKKNKEPEPEKLEPEKVGIQNVKVSDIVHIVKMGIMEELDVLKERIMNLEVLAISDFTDEITKEHIRQSLRSEQEILEQRFKEAQNGTSRTP